MRELSVIRLKLSYFAKTFPKHVYPLDIETDRRRLKDEEDEKQNERGQKLESRRKRDSDDIRRRMRGNTRRGGKRPINSD